MTRIDPVRTASPVSAIPFRKVLIANRGEIACRIERTLHALGIRSVAIHHAAEARAVHAQMADEALEISGDTPVSAYLDAGQIIGAALKAGAEAIHPGYGFLSENARFAAAVREAGLAFIGPDAETIALMGDKISARDFARAQGVPVAPSVTPTGDLDAFRAAAQTIGFPLLIKAAAGGGGKGMNIVRSVAELDEAARHSRQRSPALFWRRPYICRSLRRAPTPYRSADCRGRRRRRDPPLRAGMFGATALPEDHRGSAGRQSFCLTA